MPPLHSEFAELDSDDDPIDMTGDGFVAESHTPAPKVLQARLYEDEDVQMQDGSGQKQDNSSVARTAKKQDHVVSEDEDKRISDGHDVKPSRRIKPTREDKLAELSSTDVESQASSPDVTILSRSERQACLQNKYRYASLSLVDIVRGFNRVSSETPGSGDQKQNVLADHQNAYLDHVNFYVRIWPNYDTVVQRFHWDPQRLQDCGVLRLDPNEREALEGLNWDEYEMGRVNLLISSPFRGNLITVNLTAVPTGHGVGRKAYANAKVMQMGRPHLYLTEFVRDTCDEINLGHVLTYGTQGFQLDDVDELAAMFVRKHKRRPIF